MIIPGCGCGPIETSHRAVWGLMWPRYALGVMCSHGDGVNHDRK